MIWYFRCFKVWKNMSSLVTEGYGTIQLQNVLPALDHNLSCCFHDQLFRHCCNKLITHTVTFILILRVSITDFLVSETSLMLCKKILPSVSLNQKQNIHNFNPVYHNLSYCKQTKKTLHHHKQLLWRHTHHVATQENAAGSAATAEEPALVPLVRRGAQWFST